MPLPESLECEGLLIRRLDAQDVGDLFAHFSDPAVTEYLDIAPLTGKERAAEIIAWADRIHEGGVGVRWSMRDAETNEFLGTCGFNSVVRVHGSRGEIAYDLGRRFWGRGIMSAALPRLLSMGFEALGLNRIEALVTPGNARSARLLDRHGFRHEGRLREYGQWCGAFWDQDMHALLRREWLKANQSSGQPR